MTPLLVALDFHSLATSCMRLLPMNIDSLYSSPTNFMLGIINGSYSSGLLIWLAIDCPLELVISCSRNSSQTSDTSFGLGGGPIICQFISGWRTFFISCCGI